MKDIYESITARFIERLEQGTVPWQKPWLPASNVVSGRSYRGINALILSLAEADTPFWMTYKQATELGGCIRKGEKSMPVIYWKLLDKRDEKGEVILNDKGEPEQIPLVRWSCVFNLDQTTGIKQLPHKEPEAEREYGVSAAEKIVGNCGVPIVRAPADQIAAYDPSEDKIYMPGKGHFRSEAHYYHTVFHELTHATGHSSRLNREGVVQADRFGSERYAREELIAELGASFLMNDVGLLGEAHFENSAGYLKNWISRLKENPKLLVQASSAAQKAHDYLVGERTSVRDQISEQIANLVETASESSSENERE
jgi:antirestriction protein ArdC